MKHRGASLRERMCNCYMKSSLLAPQPLHPAELVSYPDYYAKGSIYQTCTELDFFCHEFVSCIYSTIVFIVVWVLYTLA